MSNLRRLLLDGVDKVHKEYDGLTPDHCILPRSMKGEIRLEKLGQDREFLVVSNKNRGLMGMQVWFSGALDRRGKKALLVSDEVFAQMFPTPKLFYRWDE